jgi:exonuclease III
MTKLFGQLDEYFEDVGKYVKQTHPVLGELDFFILPATTRMYKGTKYFYDTLPKTHFWVGAKRIGYRFSRMYYGGLNAYRSTKDMYLLVLNRSNLDKIYNHVKDTKMKNIMQKTYGTGITIPEHIDYIRKDYPWWGDDIWLYNKHTSERKDPLKLQYLFSSLATPIHTYIYNTYKFQGTFLPYLITPFNRLRNDEEININIDQCADLELVEDDPLYWKNWGLGLPKSSEFILNERYPNKEFKALAWYLNKVNTDVPTPASNEIRILSYNIMGFDSANELDTEEINFKKLLQLIDKLSPNVIVLQEFKQLYFTRFPSKYKYKYFASNGGYGNNVVVFTDHPAVFSKIKFKGITDRDSVLVKYKGVNIIGTHMEIGKRYSTSLTFLSPEGFAHTYESNVDMRTRQLKGLLEHKPDIIVGDFNFSSVDAEIKVLEQAGYNYSATPISSIHGAKVDFAFTNSRIKGRETIVDYYQSDHRPLLYDFSIPSYKKSGGSPEELLNSMPGRMLLATIIVILILLLILFILQTFNFCDIFDIYSNKANRTEIDPKIDGHPNSYKEQ